MAAVTYDRESAIQGADAWLDGQEAEARARFDAAGHTPEARVAYREERRRAARAHDDMRDAIDERYPEATR